MSNQCDSHALPDSPFPAARQPAQQASFMAWLGMAVLALPTLLLGLDVTILYLALPALSVELQPSSSQALWIMDAYGFMIAGFLITMGTLGDRLGRRRLLMIGATAFGVASVVAAYATNAEMLIAARAALGVAGASLMPSTLALISNLFPNSRQRSLAIGIWATMFALGMAAGPVVGGWVLSHLWWGAAFLVAVPIVVLLLIAAPMLLPEYRAEHSERLDFTSVLLSLAAILPAIHGLKELARHGVTLAPALSLLAGILIAVLFVRRQNRLSAPLLDMRLFACRTFSTALLVLLFGLIAAGGAMLLVTQYLQLVVGLSPLVAGLWMGPPALMMVIAGIAAPLMARRIPPGQVVAGALAFSSLGYLALFMVGSTPSGLLLAIGGFSLVYLGMGTIAALGTELVIGTAPAHKTGSASAMSEMAQELGIALGVALLGSLSTLVYRLQIASYLPSELSSNSVDTVNDSLWAIVSALDQPTPDIIEAAMQAFTSGLNVTAAVSGVAILGLAILAAIHLRQVPTLGMNDNDH